MRIFENGVFLSCGEPHRAFRVLVEDRGRIAFVGDVLPEASAGCPDRVDLQGRCVVPAFADAHIHFTSHALFQATLDVRDAPDLEGLGERILAYTRGLPRGKVVLGFGVSAHALREQRLPVREDLDRVTDRPVMLVKYDGHAAVVNTALLQRLPRHVTADPGCSGASGWLLQNAFYRGVDFLTRSVSLPQVLKNVLACGRGLARQGIGLVHTAEGVGFPLDLDVDLVRFAGRALPVEVRVYFQTLEVRKARRRGLPRIGGCFATALDGCFGSEAAALSAPYVHRPGYRGVLFNPQETIDAFVLEAHRAGLQVALHAIGDAAVEQALEAFEAALAAFPRNDHRHILIHANLVSEDQLDRAARLGLCFSVQPAMLFWKQEPLTYLTRILGTRAERLLPLGGMRRRGLVMAGGSDAPCTLPDPLGGIHAACNHPQPDERLSPLDALRLFTLWPARLSFDDAVRGSLEVGKKADFAVLDRNPLEVPVETLQDLRILQVWREGSPHDPPVLTPLGLCLKASASLLHRKGTP